MERLQFRFDGGHRAAVSNACIVGVVASGNLEILIEPAPQTDACAIEISTAANGFGDVWQAVMADFFERHRLGGIRISINDAGATPAIVSLRLDQAIEAFTRSAPT
ncbi:MAG TPA: malonate decarboxylase acyl carrier protein [Casimicrobiaceae bacterium]|nr:malonate decarboxylase acyl carrier protein [Casimicrobiaceae bacterium]